MSSALRTTFTRSSELFWLEAALAACAGAAPDAGFAPGIVAGFTAGAGAPGAGLADGGTAPAANSTAPVPLVLVGVCGSDFAALPVLTTALGFCPQAAPVIIATARMPVVSFISDSYLPATAVVVPGLLPGAGPAGSRS